MTLTLADILTLALAASSIITAFSVLWAKFVTPVKKVIKQVEENSRNVKVLEEKIENIKSERKIDGAFSVEVRSILLESIIAILDGLEQQGSNHIVTEQKKKIIKFMSGQAVSKKSKK
jgi:hypothetical protein